MPEPPFEFDVFLSHNSMDKPAVEKIAEILENQYKLRAWFDKWDLIPGDSWIKGIWEALDRCQTFAVFVGQAGTGAWETPELQMAVDIHVKDRTRRVIPVLLPDAPDDKNLKLPEFLKLFGWVDFRGKGYDDPDLLHQLARGIKGVPLRNREAIPRQTATLGDEGAAERLRQLRMENVQPKEQKGIELLEQPGTNTPGRRDVKEPPAEGGVNISREKLAELNQTQNELKDFIIGYIKFSEPWVECAKAKSILWDQLEHPSEELSSHRYWNDLKELLENAKTKIGADVPDFLRSKNEFHQFTKALEEAWRLVEPVQPKLTAEEKKLEIIDSAHEQMRTAVMRAKAIVELCQQGATDKLKEISVVIKHIFDAGQVSGQGASSQALRTARPADRPISENQDTSGLGLHVAASGMQERYPS
jgi:hypothetical protein